MRVSRPLAAAALALFAAAAIGSGLDRIGRRTTIMAAKAPDAIRADPLDPRGIGALAAQQLAAGESRAAATMALGDHLGRRDPLVQAYFFDRAIASGDGDYAARRLDAMLRVNPSLVSQDALFAMVAASEEGRAILRRMIAGGVSWGPAYLSGLGVGDDKLLARARVMREEDGAGLTCARIGPMLEELVKRDLAAEARDLAKTPCAGLLGTGIITDRRFAAIGSDPLFGWQRHASGDIRIAPLEDGVELLNRSAATRLALSQPVAFREGRFRAVVDVENGASEAVAVALDCGASQRPGAGTMLQSTGCDDQVLSIWLAPTKNPVRLRSLRVEAVDEVR